ncbi:MAG TPA: ATP-dependent Clp protease proteolytic subunit [Candidatus Kapabacteria bacterium]|jgi:membrane-bound serine protease (ClpP class)
MIRSFLVLVIISLSAIQPTKASDTTKTSQRVLVIEIANEVDNGMASYVDRAVEQAEKEHDVILLHVNTLGGALDAAIKIRDAILDAKVPMTIAFVDKRAISAGSLITLAAQKIVMSGGSTMGAATPIYATSEKASEKVNSYMRAEMRSTAERNHRDPRIAEAMVDESVGLDSTYAISLPVGKLLTLTTDDAKKVHYTDTTAETMEAAIAAVGIQATEIVSTEESFGDKLLRFLTSALVSSLLIMIGMAGAFYTIKTGHFGAITIAAIAAFALFFGGQYITSVAPILAIILFLAGITLLLIEISPVPTFGMAGVLGIIGVVAGLFLALAGNLNTLTPDRKDQAFVTLAISLSGVIVLGYLIIKYAPKSTWLQKFRNLSTTADTAFYGTEQSILIGKHGIAQTMLRPAGIVLMRMTEGEDRPIDAVTNGEFIAPGTEVSVLQMRGNRPVVRAVAETVVRQQDEPSPEDRSPVPESGDAFGGRLPRNL